MKENADDYEVLKQIFETIDKDHLSANPEFNDDGVKIKVKNLTDKQIWNYEKIITKKITPFVPKKYRIFFETTRNVTQEHRH